MTKPSASTSEWVSAAPGARDIRDGNDYNVCTTWALSGKDCYLLDVYRERLEFYALEAAVHAQRKQWKADL